MRDSIQRPFQNIYTQRDPLSFYTKFTDDVTGNGEDTASYSYLRLNYYFNQGELIMKKYKAKPCGTQSAFMAEYYPQNDVECIDPDSEDKEPFTIDGVTYEWTKDPDTVHLDGLYRTYDTNGRMFYLMLIF